ncbi:hypothetical protein OAD35_06485, partial [Pseudomonadales bacterium]|nr:hypothetical protein [Pseudomonadales bacterium]
VMVIEDLAEHLGISNQSLFSRLAEKSIGLPFKKLGQHYLFVTRDVAHWADANELERNQAIRDTSRGSLGAQFIIKTAESDHSPRRASVGPSITTGIKIRFK